MDQTHISDLIRSSYYNNKFNNWINTLKNSLSKDKATQLLQYALNTYTDRYDSDSGQFVPEQESSAKKEQVIKIAIQNGANLRQEEISKLINSAVSLDVWIPTYTESLSKDEANQLLQYSLDTYLPRYQDDSGQFVLKQESVTKQEQLVKIAIQNGANLEQEEISKLINSEVSLDIWISTYTKSLSKDEANQLLQYALDTTLDLYRDDSGQFVPKQESITKKDHLIKIVIQNGASIDDKSNFEVGNTEFSFLEQIVFEISHQETLDDDSKYKEIDYFIDQSNIKTIGCECLMMSANASPIYAAGLLQKFPNTYDEEYIVSFGRTQGASHVQIQTVTNIFSLAYDINEYRAITTDDSSTCSKRDINNDFNSRLPLTETEMSLLDPDIEPLSIAEYEGAILNNKYGFTALHLSMIGQKYSLAVTMIQTGFDPQATSSSGLTPLHIFSTIIADRTSEGYDALIQHVLYRTGIDVDTPFPGSGETLAHSFLSGTSSSDPELQSAILDKTNDPLFVFSKEPSNLFAPYQHPEKTHIAISNGEGFWSTGSWSLANLMTQKHGNVEFHLISHNLIQNIPDQYKDAFLNQFDGFINPGAGDTYPKHPFTKNDWEPQMDLEKLYQNVIDHSLKNDSPIVGICAGTQHLALYHGGTVAPLKGYGAGQHTISFIEGSLPYFMMLSKEQQKQALLSCEFPKVEIKGDTAHHFAAVIHKLGDGIHIGAVSEDYIPMAYNHENGIRYGTQFHPEHYYKAHSVDENVPGFFESNFFNNFIELARLNHAYKLNPQENLPPIDLVATINNRLSECTLKPTCVTSIDLTGVDSSFYDDHNVDDTAA